MPKRREDKTRRHEGNRDTGALDGTSADGGWESPENRSIAIKYDRRAADSILQRTEDDEDCVKDEGKGVGGRGTRATPRATPRLCKDSGKQDRGWGMRDCDDGGGGRILNAIKNEPKEEGGLAVTTCAYAMAWGKGIYLTYFHSLMLMMVA